MTPYIVTVKQHDDRNCDCHIPALEGAGQHSPGCACFDESRRAVGSLDEAHVFAAEQALEHGANHLENEDALELPESGGTVGPLPDGTVIEVEATAVDALLKGVPDERRLRNSRGNRVPMYLSEIIAAYNEAQGARA